METIFFERKTIIEFLTNNSYNYQKYNELLAAVIMSSWYSAGIGMEDAPIGFAIKRKYYRTIVEDSIDLEQIQKIIDIEVENDTPIDVIISHVPIDKMVSVKMNIKLAWAYQVKRFIERPGENATEKLLEYLNKKIPIRYAKTNARLLLLLEITTSIDLLKVAKLFNHQGFPFSHVQFIMFDFSGNNSVKFGDIFPERNMYVGNINRFFEL